MDQIYEGKMTVFQELLGDCDSSKGLDVLLASPGGSGEMALRMVQSMQNQCKDVRPRHGKKRSYCALPGCR